MRALWLASSALVMSCAGVEWGQGGAEPPRETAGAFVRTIDGPMLELASTRLAHALGRRWVDGAKLVVVPGALAIDWRSWLLMPGTPWLELGPGYELQAGAVLESKALLVHVPIAGATHEISISTDVLLPCSIRVSVADGVLDVPVAFTADKLGRVQGVVQPGTTFHAADSNNAVLQADLSGCMGGIEPGVHLAALGATFVEAAAASLTEAISAELPAALGLDVAFGWSGAVNADAMGTGFMRTSLRGLTDALVRRRADALQLEFALSIEADAHPCMSGLGLSVPRAEVTWAELAAGAALHISALERIVAAQWVAGAACADHVGVAATPVAELETLWPELARMGPDAVVSLELWPGAVPRLAADPAFEDGLVFDTGRIRADVIVTYAGARWRAASVVLELSVSGSLWVDPAGQVFFDPAAVDAVPTSIDAGLLGTPSPEAIAALLPTLVEALVSERGLAMVPPQLAPVAEGARVEVSGDYLSWPTR